MSNILAFSSRIALPLIFLFQFQSLFAQTTTESAIQLITPDVLAEVTIDQDAYISWIKTWKEAVEKSLAKEKGKSEFFILSTIYTDKKPAFQLHTRGKVSKKTRKKLANILAKTSVFHSKLSTYSIGLLVTTNGGIESDEISFEPPIETADEQRLHAFEHLSLPEKKRAFEHWIRTEVLPIVAAFETSADPQFEGVVSVGKMLDDPLLESKSVAELTDNNPLYWRAVMEMQKGNQLIPFTKMCLHFLRGEYAHGEHLLFSLSFFSKKTSLFSVYETDFKTYFRGIQSEISTIINQGIALHDDGKYNEALTYYRKLLPDFEKNAWLNYEIYFSEAAKELDFAQKTALWDSAKTTIYQNDPLYPIQVAATNGKEGYLMFRRQEIGMLFKTEAYLKEDFVKYADIALELGDYAFAAQLYWLISLHLPQEVYGERNLLAHFAYCMQKLECPEILSFFTPEVIAAIPSVEQERDAEMRASEMFRSFGE